MATITQTGIKCEYKCSLCGIDYSEQRLLGEPQFFVNCQKIGCAGQYELVSETQFTYEQEIPDPMPIIEPDPVVE